MLDTKPVSNTVIIHNHPLWMINNRSFSYTCDAFTIEHPSLTGDVNLTALNCIVIMMAFIAPACPSSALLTSKRTHLSGRRTSLPRLRPPMDRRVYTACQRPPYEDSYLLRDSVPEYDQFSSESIITEPDDGNPHDSNSFPIDEAPGIVQKTTDLDGRVLFGEFLSTFLFVYLSVNAAILPSPVANSLNNAAVIAAIAASFMPVSGAHLNPAVTLALLVTKRVSLKRALAFIPVQLFAAATACFMTNALGTTVAFAGIAAAATKTDIVRAFFHEFVPMFIIVAVVFQTAVATEREGGVGNKIAALYIGLAVLACAGTFLTGIFNPARAFGPALLARNFAHHWVYWLGPISGAILAAFICEHLFLAPASKRAPKSWLSDIFRKSSDLNDRVRTLGVAGLIGYGIMNTAYYSIVFSYMMVKIGLSSGASGIAKAWLVTWSLSQVTKPLRLAASIAMAPFINRFLRRRDIRTRKYN